MRVDARRVERASAAGGAGSRMRCWLHIACICSQAAVECTPKMRHKVKGQIH